MERDIKSNFNFKSAKERVSKVINKTELIKSDYSMLGRRVGSYEVDGRRLVDGKLGQTCVRVSIGVLRDGRELLIAIEHKFGAVLEKAQHKLISPNFGTFA